MYCLAKVFPKSITQATYLAELHSFRLVYFKKKEIFLVVCIVLQDGDQVYNCQASKTAFRSHCARPDGTLLCERGCLTLSDPHSKREGARGVQERGVVSEFSAARARGSYWFDKVYNYACLPV